MYKRQVYLHVNKTTRQPPDKARVTPTLEGRVHVLHSTQASMCNTFNQYAAVRRQMLMRTVGKTRHPKGWLKSIYRYDTMRSHEDCTAVLGADSPYCLLDGLQQFASERRASAAWINLSSQPPPVPNPFIKPTVLEDWGAYAVSRRCGPLCSEYFGRDTLGTFNLKLAQNEEDFRRSTPCISAAVVTMRHMVSHEVTCQQGDVLRSIMFTGAGCPSATPGKKWMHWTFRCNHNAPSGVEYTSSVRYTRCLPHTLAPLSALSEHAMACPEGYALSGVSLRSDTCAKDHASFRYECSSLLVGSAHPPGRTAEDLRRSRATAAEAIEQERAVKQLTGGEMYGTLPVRAAFSDTTPCTPGGESISLDALGLHPVLCPVTHAVQSFKLAPCDLPGEIRMLYRCVPVRAGVSTGVAYLQPQVGRPKLRSSDGMKTAM